MNKFDFNPSNGLKDGTAYPNPSSESETREQLQRPLDQIKNFINSFLTVLSSSKGVEEIGTPDGDLGSVLEKIKKNDNFDEDDADSLIHEVFGEDIDTIDEYTLDDSNSLYEEVFGDDI